MKPPGQGQTRRGVGRRQFLRQALLSGGIAAGLLRKPGSLVLAQTLAGAGPSKGVPAADQEVMTANADFFVRNHFATQRIRDDAWHLEIGGLVSKPLQLSYSDLLLMPSVRRPSTLECAGNVSGGGGVGTADWSGLSLGELLHQAGLQPGATTVVFYGADSGQDEHIAPGTHFVRSIPLEKALDASTLLAYEMNGEPLPPEHGFPLRAVVPGWYGMDSVKWLTRVEVLREPFKGYFQDEKYVALGANGESRTITKMRVSSKFFRPSNGEEIRGVTYRLEGAAWAGERKVARVEVRVNGGDWRAATLLSSPVALIWTRWSYDWHVPATGRYSLEVRATDEDGNSQPAVRDQDRKDPYELNTSQRIQVTVS